MQTFNDILSSSFVSGGVFDAYDLVGWDDQKIAANDAKVKCVAKSPSTAAGQDYAGMLAGIARVKAASAIAAGGTALVTAAAGGVKPRTGEEANVFAVALHPAAANAFVDIFFFIR